MLPAGAKDLAKHDRNGFRTSLQVIDGATLLDLAYTADAAGRMETISRVGTGTVASYTFDDVGRRQTVTYQGTSSASTTTYDYDPIGRLTSLINQWNGSNVSAFTYADHDGVGNYHARTDARLGSPSPATDQFAYG